MDLYLNGGDSLSLSLQDMLDCDIKTEVDSVLAGDLSLGDLPSFDMDEESLGSHMWFSNNGLHNGNSNSSNSNFNLDFVGGDAAALMVNPNSVMPLTLMPSSQKTVVEATSTDADVSSDVETPDSSPSTSPPAPSYIRAVSATSTAAVLSPRMPTGQAAQQRTVPTMIRIAAKPAQIASTTFAPTTVTTSTKTVPIITSSAKLHKQLQQLTNGTSINSSSVTTLPRTIQIHPSHLQAHTVHTLPQQSKKQQFHVTNKHYVEMDYDDRSYPKPAYSYSCLIAMALKNSKTGSLPVSDIYSFMCEHFPYFKTAPSGWKNSVRHNLSLNKCFEKIEKATGNGSQRKGCLWAMNPAKIAKMDDEVQKWSRKDPAAIKKAMVFPENLEMLERGEMKMSSRSELEAMGNGDETETSEDGDGEADNDTDVDMDGDVDEGVAPNQEDDEDESEVDEDATSTTEITSFPADFIIDNIPDSFDESSLTELDIEVADGIYEELDLSEAKKLNLVDLKRSAAESSIGASRGSRRTHSDPDQQDGYDFGLDQDEPPISRSRIQGNYIYKPVVSIDGSFTTTSTSRRKQPLLVRSSSASIIKCPGDWYRY